MGKLRVAGHVVPGAGGLHHHARTGRSLRGLGWGWGRTRYFLIATASRSPCVCSRTCSSGCVRRIQPKASSSRSSPRRGCLRLARPARIARGRAGHIALTGLISAAGEKRLEGLSRPRCMHSWASPVRACSSVSSGRRGHIRSTLRSFLCTGRTCRLVLERVFQLAVIGISFMHTWLRITIAEPWPRPCSMPRAMRSRAPAGPRRWRQCHVY